MARRYDAVGVTRVEIPEKYTFGWMMRIKRGQHTPPNEWFPDKKHGGKVAAYRAAVKRYQKLDSTLPKDTLSSKNRMTKRNKTGKVGVHLKVTMGRKSSKNEYHAYDASWVQKDGRRKHIGFSWNRYGNKVAWRLACYARDNEIGDRKKILKRFRIQT